MTELKHKTPCDRCPWRRTSLRGWLGVETPSGFLWATQRESMMPCHCGVDYEDPDWEAKLEGAAHCAGSLVFLKNNMQLPVNRTLREMVEQVEKSDDVFQWGKEFLDHHTIEPFCSNRIGGKSGG
jgi:hypothetical protein